MWTSTTITWNHAGRMTKAIVPGGASEGTVGIHNYGYDANGKRIWKKVNPTSNPMTETV